MTVTYINPPGAMPAQGLYSHAGTATGGQLYFVAGQLAVGAQGEIVGVGDFERQFDQVYANLEGVLRGLGGSIRSVVKFTTFLTSRGDIPKFMARRAATFPKYFPSPVYPPNTLLLVSGLVKPEFVIEVEAVAAI